MLRFFRRRMKVIMWVLVVTITVPFVFWGVTTRFRGTDERPGAAGELFGRRISNAEFDEVFASMAANAYWNRSPLDREALVQLTWEYLSMREAAKAAGVAVSDMELASRIRQMFGPGESFDPARYETMLRLSGVTPEAYEEWLRGSLMIERARELVTGAAWVPDDELERRCREERTKLTIRYVLDEAKNEEASVRVSDEEAREYYEAHARSYTRPASVKARYLLIPWSAPPPPPAVSDEEVARYYAEHPGEFAHGERVKTRHILFRPEGGDPQRADEKAARRAGKVLKKLRAGADFAKLARSYSDDEKTREGGGDIGFIERTGMPSAFSEKAFAMNEGEVSEPVKTPSGYHIIKVEGRQGAGTKPLEEVAEGIRANLERERQRQAAGEAKKAAYSKAVDVSLALVGSTDLEAITRAHSLESGEVGPFTASEPPVDLGSDFAKAAFDTEPGAFSDIIEIPGKGYCIVLPHEKRAETQETFEEARGAIVKALREEKASAAARAKAERQRAEVAEYMGSHDADFATACKALSIPWKESASFAPWGSIGELGRDPRIAREAAALPVGALSPVMDTPNGSCFFAVEKREEPPPEEVASGLDPLRRRILREREGKLLAEWSRLVREEAKLLDYLSAARPESD